MAATKDSSLTKSSFIGLRNQGATCYLNSLIQTLFLTPEFRKQLFSLTADEVGLDDINGNNDNNHNNNNNNSNKPNKKKRKKIIVELMKLFARLQKPDFEGEYNCNYHALSTKSLTNSFGWNAAQAQDQHDINELYNLLLDGINQQMPKNKQFLEKYYQGSSVNVIICQQCKYNSKQNEKFNQLNIILQDPFKKTSFDSLNHSLLSNYLDNTEDLKDDNAYFCPQCNKKVHAQKKTLLTKLPPIIVCNLNRFYFDLEAGERKKINKKFKFSKTLNLGAFVEHEFAEMEKGAMTEYDLIGIVVHRGSGAKAGHYHAYIRDMNNEAIWKPIKRKRPKRNKRRNNRRSNRNNTDKEQRKKEQKDKAIAMLVSILSEHEQLTKNSLHNKFRSMNNLTEWKWSFERDLGPFATFLKNNHRFRILNESKRSFSVCLANDSDIDNDNDNGNYINLASETDDEDMNKQKKGKKGKGKSKGKKKRGNDLKGFVVGDDAGSDEEFHPDDEDDEDLYEPSVASSTTTSPSPQRKVRGNKNKKSPSKSPASPDLNEEEKDDEKKSVEVDTNSNAAHWYDFNDEEITAVYDKEIDDLYDGGDDECPYMVIYRRKCMDSTSFPPEIPLYVEQLLIDEPLDAEEDKQELSITIIKLNMDIKLVRNPLLRDTDDENESENQEMIDIDININNTSQHQPKIDDDEDDDDVQMIDNTNNNSVKSENNGTDKHHAINLADSNSDSISDDDNDLVINSPSCDVKCHLNNNDKENINGNVSVDVNPIRMSTNSNGTHSTKKRITRSRKRNFQEFSSENENEDENTNNSMQKLEPDSKRRKVANGNSLTNLPDPKDQKERMSVSPSPSSSASPGKGGKKKKNNNNKGKSNSRSRGKSKSKSKSRSPQPEKIEMKYVKSTYLAPIQNITKGTTVEELYKEMAEWSQIKLENLQIAKILDKGRKHSRDPKIVNFAEKDVKMKLKRIPIDTKDDILIWDKNEGDLAEQELKRRRECIKLTVWVCIKGGNGGDHDSDYPQSIHINPKETLHDLFDQLKEQLTDEQKKIIEGEGRFRDIDTHKIYRNHDCTLKKLQIKRNHSLRFEKETIPKDNEIVIRFRIKNSEYKHANRSPEHELYISKDERVSMLKAMMASKFEVEAASYEVRKARSNWTLGQKCEGKSFEYVKQCKFDKTQIVILAQTIDKTKRSLDIYCQTQIIDNRKVFKIPKILLLDDNENGVIIEEEKKEESISSPESSSVINKGMNVVKDVVNVLQRPIGSRASLKSPASAEDGDITMEENMDNKDNKDDTDAKENDIDNNQLIPPKDDGMDVYPENSEILCTLVVDKSFNGLQIKKAFRECKELNLNTRLKSDIELTYFTMSMSKKAKNQSRMRWEIMNQSWCHKGIQNANPRGRVIAEFHNEPFKDDIYRRDQESKILLFIYKMCANYNNNEHATYGSRYRITVTVKQRTKLDALKQTIINKCDWKSSLKASNIMLAVRNIDSHKWTVITSKLTQKKSTNKKGHKRAAKRSPPKEKIVQQKLFDRDIIAVMDVSHLTNQEKDDIVENPVCFETEFDKYYYLKYLRQQQEKEDDESDDGDAVPLLINFQNDSQEDNDNNDKNQEDK